MSDHTDASWDAERPDVAYENAHGWQDENELTERIAKLEAENEVIQAVIAAVQELLDDESLSAELACLKIDTALASLPLTPEP